MVENVKNGKKWCIIGRKVRVVENGEGHFVPHLCFYRIFDQYSDGHLHRAIFLL